MWANKPKHHHKKTEVVLVSGGSDPGLVAGVLLPLKKEVHSLCRGIRYGGGIGGSSPLKIISEWA